MSAGHDYARDGAEIYRRSFAIIRSEADLSRFTPDEARVAVRIIHACGMVEIASDLVFGARLRRRRPRRAARKASRSSATRRWWRTASPGRGSPPATRSSARSTLPGIADRAARLDTTRSAAALDLWLDRLGGSLVAIGNAPTALFRLLELIDQGAPKPAAIIGMPVGFVGAAESKEALAGHGGVPFLIVKGRKGGSAMAVAAVNALASEAE